MYYAYQHPDDAAAGVLAADHGVGRYAGLGVAASN
jgi:hypothetical protein